MAVEEKQAVVLEQPKDQKVYLDVQHSTDTTAIWSFVIAMVVAFILGVSATIIAIWYGRKSFKLTEMSFKTVVEEIRTSQQSAIDLNTRLFEQQKSLLNIQVEENRYQIRLFNVKSSGGKFIASVNKFILYAENFEKNYFDLTSKVKLDVHCEAGQLFLNLRKLSDQILLDIVGLELDSDNSKDFEKIIHLGNFICVVIEDLLNDYIDNNLSYLKKFEIFEFTPKELMQDYTLEDLEQYYKLKVIGLIIRNFSMNLIKILNKKAA